MLANAIVTFGCAPRMPTTRRRFVCASIALGTSVLAKAQRTLQRVVFLSPGTEPTTRAGIEAFLSGMRQAGHEDGRTYRLELHHAEGDDTRMVQLIRQAAASQPAVICIPGLRNVKRAHDTTRAVPIVMTTGSDLVDAGLARSHARPGGNVTGVADNSDETLGKRFAFTRELLPLARRFALLVNPDFPATPKMERTMREAGQRGGVALRVLHARDPAALDAAIASLGSRGTDALVVGGDTLLTLRAKETIDKATALAIPVVHYWPTTPEMGAVLVYSVDILDNFRRSAWYVDRILKGERAGDLPIHQPTRYELAINAKAARALGISVPDSLRARAERVID